MILPIELETTRLLLRQWKPADRDPFAALNADPLVMQYFPAPLTRDESNTLAERCERLIAETGWGPWATAIKKTGELIGFVGLNVLSDRLPISPGVEILWRLARAHWHQGFATEAAQGVLRIGFEMLELPEIVSFTVPANIRSRAVMQRLGMKMDEATFEHPGLPPGHVLRTHCSYRLARSDWLPTKGIPPSHERA
jgi:RimJ/RimL family protein N-acetyltransferase